MSCKIDGCEKPVMYSEQGVCQMHYFRFMRNCTYEKVNKRTIFIREFNGYIKVYKPQHPLSLGDGFVFEHRMIVYDRIGESLCECEICKKPVTWETVHIDHIDTNKKNNSTQNLRPLCNGCNTRRGYPEQHTVLGRMAITYEGETKTPSEWARDSRISIASHTIRNRIKAGKSVEFALFGEKITHNGNEPKPYVPITNALHERKNSIAITIDGVTKTAKEWSRDDRCMVSDTAIRFRIKAGWNPADAVFKTRKELKRGC